MARARVKYTPDPKGIRALAQDPKMFEAMAKIGEHAKAYAESISPHGESGEYARSFVVRPTEVALGWRKEPRGSAVVENTSDHAVLVETVNGDRVLAKTAQFADSGARVRKPSARRSRSKPSGM